MTRVSNCHIQALSVTMTVLENRKSDTVSDCCSIPLYLMIFSVRRFFLRPKNGHCSQIATLTSVTVTDGPVAMLPRIFCQITRMDSHQALSTNQFNVAIITFHDMRFTGPCMARRIVIKLPITCHPRFRSNLWTYYAVNWLGFPGDYGVLWYCNWA